MHVLLRGDWGQRLRLISGLILFSFATTHFLNHALGLFDLQAMYEVQQWRWTITRSWPGTIILASALVTHVVLALDKLSDRSTLRLPTWELLQIGLGLSIPFLLFPHIVNTRVARDLFGVNDTYLYELARLWPESAILQSSLLLLVWIHGCIGIHFWLRLYGPYRKLQPILLFFALAIPAAALGGFMVGGRTVAQMIADPKTFEEVKRLSHWPSPENADLLANYRFMVRMVFGAMLVVAFAFFAWPILQRRYWPHFVITYIGGNRVNCTFGPTLLEISRLNGVPHASVCGGRARCSTCRVRIEDGVESVPPATFPEAVTLASINAPPNVRLACQIRPKGPMTITRLLRPSTTGPEDVDEPEFGGGGLEKPLVVFVLDLRDFTRLAQTKLPHDVVFLLNELFGAAGSAIAAHEGWIDKFLGDGLLAVFGDKRGVETGCRQALRAARAIDLALDHINAKMEEEFGRPLKVGIGIEAGPLLIGRIGYGPNVDVTVIGRAVNVASRLEAMTKEKGVQIVISREVAKIAGWEPPAELVSTVNVRGLSEAMDIVAIGRGRDLPASILASIDDPDTGAGARSNPPQWPTGV
jgi:adenylate cyclase